MLFLAASSLENISIGDAGIIALLGYATVFAGLILLMIVVTIVGKIFIASSKRTAAKTTAKKPAAKKTAAKKPSAKKTAEKKTTAKSTTKTAAKAKTAKKAETDAEE